MSTAMGPTVTISSLAAKVSGRVVLLQAEMSAGAAAALCSSSSNNDKFYLSLIII